MKDDAQISASHVMMGIIIAVMAIPRVSYSVSTGHSHKALTREFIPSQSARNMYTLPTLVRRYANVRDATTKLAVCFDSSEQTDLRISQLCDT